MIFVFRFKTTDKDANLILILRAVCQNPYIDIRPILETIATYLTKKLTQNIDLDPTTPHGHEMTIRGTSQR